MTGMPGFEKTLSSAQVWQVSLLLANSDKLPNTVKDSLTSVGTPTPMSHSMTK
jgi:hypothetical protein